VIASNVSSLPEIAGDAALLIDPRSLTELARRPQPAAAVGHSARRSGRQGRVRARAFRWEACAAQSLLFFREVAGG